MDRPSEPHLFPTTNYRQPYYGTATTPPLIAELPALLPPAPPTSTSPQQLTEDELLAHQLQKMEVEELRRRSSSILNHRPSQQFLGPSHSPQITQGPLQQPSTSRPHSLSVTSLSSQTHNSTTGFPSEFTPSNLPEVMVEPGLIPLDENKIVPAYAPQTAKLPSAPTGSASLAKYLDEHRRVPYPPQWVLQPPVKTFYGSFIPGPKSDWLDLTMTREWRTVRFSQNASNPTPPSYSFSFRTKGGHLRDPQYTWTMHSSTHRGKLQKSATTWSYQLKMNPNTCLRKSELLYTPSRKEVLTTYIHARNYDSLRFVGPDGRLYLWVTHAPLSSTNGSRFDTLRHALFASTKGHPDPLYGEIVADHTYWDGYVDYNEFHTGITCRGCSASPLKGLRWKCKTCVDHDVCDLCRVSQTSVLPTCTFTLVNLPDEALTIRSPTVDTALVVATLQIMKDWELHTIRSQKRIDPKGFEATELAARKTDLGRISHWRSSDFTQSVNAPADAEVYGTVVKKSELAKTAAAVAKIMGTVGETAGSSFGGDGGSGAAADGGGSSSVSGT